MLSNNDSIQFIGVRSVPKSKCGMSISSLSQTMIMMKTNAEISQMMTRLEINCLLDGFMVSIYTVIALFAGSCRFLYSLLFYRLKTYNKHAIRNHGQGLAWLLIKITRHGMVIDKDQVKNKWASPVFQGKGFLYRKVKI